MLTVVCINNVNVISKKLYVITAASNCPVRLLIIILQFTLVRER